MSSITDNRQAFVSECRELYQKTLQQDVIPFWMTHALGTADGAINNCLDDNGSIQSTDRFIWSQGRALWTFSALYNRIEKRDEWLDAARGIFSYLSNHGRDERGRWMFRLDESGNVLERDVSIYADSFVLAGMTEYFKATGDRSAADIALDTYHNTLSRISNPGSYGVAPYSIPSGAKVLGIPMIFSFFYHELGKALNDPDILHTGYSLAREILMDFYVREEDAVHELVSLDGRPLDTPEGQVSVPGHVLEAMWFLISIFEHTGEDDLINRCCKIIRKHIELGWDEEFGGIKLAINLYGEGPVAWHKADYKPWWVQCEALVATAYAYLHTREDWCLEWHRRIKNYAFSHYPVTTGEWTQWLDRYGDKGETAALPVKDPFHLPRALIYLIDLLNRL